MVGSSLRALRRSFCLRVRPLVLEEHLVLDDVFIFVGVEGMMEVDTFLVASIVECIG